MRSSSFLLATLKESPAEATIISHKLMLRAGLIRKLSSGIYTWLPLGLRVLRKVEAIVREEMCAIGAQEVLMPMVQPTSLWQTSGRINDYGKELLRFNDRHGNEFCLGPTHEEVITDLVGQEIRSYKQLPQIFFQIQGKFRDEIRPRFGIMRAREFLMKDAYSFHITQASLDDGYKSMHTAYTKIFTRLGLKFRSVLADSGAIGGDNSEEFCVLAENGEDSIAFSNESDYAANIEKAEALAITCEKEDEKNLEIFDTPNAKTIAALVENHQIPIEKTVKTLFVKGSETALVALVLRGDHELNELKAEKLSQVASPLCFAEAEDVVNAVGAGFGSLGVVKLDVPIIADRSAAELYNFSCGANINDKHYRHVNWQRDANYDTCTDIRNVVEGDTSPDGKGSLSITRAIEVGHIFQNGDKYTKTMKTIVLDENGKAVTLLAGCYGIGVSRTVAAAIEQNFDDRGIVWPDIMAPFQVAIVSIGGDKSTAVRDKCEELYQQLLEKNVEVFLDDRKERPGVKFADMDLIGIPHRIVVGERGLNEGKLEYKYRKTGDSENIDVNKAVAFLLAKF